jgi:NAD+ kinase
MPKIKKVGIFYNPEKKHIKDSLDIFEKLKQKNNIMFHIFEEWPSSIPKIDIAIALGGDGTILRLGRYLAGSDIPIMGVNMGRLGFLAETNKDELFKNIEDIFSSKKYYIQSRNMLDISIKRNGAVFQNYLAVNDVVVKNGEKSRILDLDLFVEKEFVARYTGDGIIISTPTGSTAYSLASGGPIVYPTLDVVAISAICPHTMTLRPLIVGSNNMIYVKTVTPDSDKKNFNLDAIISIDGQINQKIFDGDEIIIKKSDKNICLMFNKEHGYFEVLRKKLNWGNR